MFLCGLISVYLLNNISDSTLLALLSPPAIRI